ncbi:MAG: 1-acyl-sn-glycerol-3-phosphate acyltransferase, partial [Schleiferiaceae bacterium]|nr:1-acyl-sn-glycerol-3-phosphate acyltransferase [Schleiferiaceae bacterium]
GTAHIIKETQPVVVPVVINGFRRAFDKKGLMMKKRSVDLSIRFKEPLDIDYSQSARAILDQIMDSIEQTEDYNTMKNISREEEPSQTHPNGDQAH